MSRCSVLSVAFLITSTLLVLGEDAGTLAGRVVDPDGRPVAGATVTLDFPGQPPLGKAVSAGDGTFSITVTDKDVAPHLHRHPGASLVASADGFAANYVAGRHLSLFPGQVKQLGDIQLGEGHTFTGTILDAGGKPAKDAVIECSTLRRYMGQTVLPVGNTIEVTTDEYGRYKTPPLPQGIRSFLVRARNHAFSGLTNQISDQPLISGAMPELKLTAEEPIVGSLVSANGEPIRDQEIVYNQWKTKTDDQGRFELHSCGPTVQIRIQRPGSSPINFAVARKPEGFEYFDVARLREIEDLQGDPPAYAKALEGLKVVRKSVDLKLQPVAYIRGTVVDDETNQPVVISRIVMCNFTRKANGAVVLNGCRSPEFKQPKPGEFELDYWFPTEYHLAISAPGYEDAEAFTPLVTTREDVDGIEVRMKRKAGDASGVASFQQRIRGTVNDNGKPLVGARVALWMLPRKWNSTNVAILRGRTTVGDGQALRSTVTTDGTFDLEVPYQGDQWYVMAETPKGVVAMVGPLDVNKGNIKPVDVVAKSGGGLRGRVSNPAATAHRLHAILFSDVGLQYEVPIETDGRFEFRDVFPGQYGLKVGCDMISRDTEVPQVTFDTPLEERLKIGQQEATPWKRATKVEIEEGKIVEDVTAEYEE